MFYIGAKIDSKGPRPLQELVLFEDCLALRSILFRFNSFQWIMIRDAPNPNPNPVKPKSNSLFGFDWV